MTQTRKLIEVSLPLEDINRESAREKSIRHGHPSTLHLWWSRKPTAAARAVLFAQLVDDPSSHLDKFPTEEDQKVERQRLHSIIRRLVAWESIDDDNLLREAHEEILKSTGGNPPTILDPFAGGGTIPLEAQRLGLNADASDLNPVAVLINKALIEIPPAFAARAPVFPGAADSQMGGWPRATGLAEDVRRYGAWMRDRAQERIGHLYPTAKLPNGGEATVAAWLWARTVTCPNPACGIEMPLTSKWWLGKKKGKESYVVPSIVMDPSALAGKRVDFSIGHTVADAPGRHGDGTVGRAGAHCVACGSTVELAYIRAEGKAGRMGAQLMATVVEGTRQRVYLPPTTAQTSASDVPRPASVPEGDLPASALGFRVQGYGMTAWADLFTNRQLTTLTTFSDLVAEAREQTLADALAAGLPDSSGPLEEGTTTASAYADAIATYLGLAVSRFASYNSTLCRWRPDAGKEQVNDSFSRPAIQMVWDVAEANPFSGSAGGWGPSFEFLPKAITRLPASIAAPVRLADAATRDYAGFVVSTDPPYYDNIGYSDLSDFFYVWLRRSLRGIHPGLSSTILVPKAEELVANPYRHGGKDGASQFFKEGFEHVFARARGSASDDFPISVYYAFKQQELESEGITSTGWATMLEGMIRAGWSITATWPVRSELGNRMRSLGSNALASSIVLALRPRRETAETTNRRGFLASLKTELPRALGEMRQAAIAPVDLAQATIGPGMAIFSRYSRVIESDGSQMTVRMALALINQALDEVLAEQDGDLDADSRFCLRWYTQFGWRPADFGAAETMANAVNVPVKRLEAGGVLVARDGLVRLVRPADLPRRWDPVHDDRISVWEVTCHLARALTTDGLDAAARLMAAAGGRVDPEAVQMLAYRIYELAQHKDREEAGLFNALGTEWSALSAAVSHVGGNAAQDALDLDSL